MKVAAYQAPLLPCGSMEGIELIRECVNRCEAEGVATLCCPETILGGLADDAAQPVDFAIDSGRLDTTLAPLESATVTTIVGFTEISSTRKLYNSAAVYHRGSVLGVYRKMHPAMRRSVYQPGNRVPVFRVGGLAFGILICNDSNFPDLARAIAAQGATAIFVPTNNSLSPERSDVVAESRKMDVQIAKVNSVWIIRADVAGRTSARVSLGSSSIVAPDGTVVRTGRPLAEDFLTVDIGAQVRRQSRRDRSWDDSGAFFDTSQAGS